MTATPEDREADLAARRADIFRSVTEYQAVAFEPKPFLPGETPIPVTGKVFDAAEMVNLTDAALEFWLTAGRFSDTFETRFAERMDMPHALLCNSGSSANLLSVAALCDPARGDLALVPGDEVITVAAGFPTTVSPLVQYGLVPVFCDLDPVTYNIDVTQLEAAVGPRTRAVMAAHTLGNPFDLAAVTDLCRRHDLILVEDTCDAVGARYQGRAVGSFGSLATASFYPAHQLTMGEGGAVLCADGGLRRIVESLRDWGRACWCPPGHDDTCGRRFGWQLGTLPAGYDHKYIYERLGYNLKSTDLQASVGVAQLEKLDTFVATRRRNWQRLHDALAGEEWFRLPAATADSEPSWFGFVITIDPAAPFTRWDLIRYLDDRKIGTRLLFGGNLLRQPGFAGVTHRTVGPLTVSDTVAERTFWVGCWPGLGDAQIDYIASSLRDFTATPVSFPRPAALRRVDG